MANKVVGTTITLTKGDTFKRTLILKDKATGDIYYPVEGDSIRFAAKKKYTDSTCLIYKEIPTDTMLLLVVRICSLVLISQMVAR